MFEGVNRFFAGTVEQETGKGSDPERERRKGDETEDEGVKFMR